MARPAHRTAELQRGVASSKDLSLAPEIMAHRHLVALLNQHSNHAFVPEQVSGLFPLDSSNSSASQASTACVSLCRRHVGRDAAGITEYCGQESLQAVQQHTRHVRESIQELEQETRQATTDALLLLATLSQVLEDILRLRHAAVQEKLAEESTAHKQVFAEYLGLIAENSCLKLEYACSGCASLDSCCTRRSCGSTPRRSASSCMALTRCWRKRLVPCADRSPS